MATGLLIESELKLRIFQHKVSILGAYITEQYIKEQEMGEVSIPEFMREKPSMSFIAETIQQYQEQGVFDEKYAEAWEYIGTKLPDNYGTLM